MDDDEQTVEDVAVVVSAVSGIAAGVTFASNAASTIINVRSPKGRRLLLVQR